MSAPEPDRSPLTADEAKALAALKRAGLPAVPDHVRERIRQVFLTGDAQPGRSPVATPEARRGSGGRRALWMGAGLAAAAAVAILMRIGLEPEGVWRVTDAVAPVGIEVQDRPLGSRGPDSLAVAGRIRVGASSELEIGLDDRLRLRLLSGTEASIPAAPGRWFGRARTIEIRSGEIFGATAGPLGFRLRLSTPEAEAVLTGTSFAVIRNEEATCFCLYRGRLDITERNGGGAIELPTEHRVVVYRDGRPPRIEPITDRERMKLSMMDGAGPAPPPSR